MESKRCFNFSLGFFWPIPNDHRGPRGFWHGTCGFSTCASGGLNPTAIWGQDKVIWNLPRKRTSVPETNSSPLQIGHPKRKRSNSNHPFSGAKMLVSGRVYVYDVYVYIYMYIYIYIFFFYILYIHTLYDWIHIYTYNIYSYYFWVFSLIKSFPACSRFYPIPVPSPYWGV